MNRLMPLFTCFLLLFSGACASTSPPAKDALERAYKTAVRDASVVETSEIASDLVAVSAANDQLIWNDEKTKILVVTWKSKESYERFLKGNRRTDAGEAFVVWVTTVPEVRDFCRGYIKENPGSIEGAVSLRLKQFLGLNHTWHYDVFIEMWVSPEDLFRPCVDPEPTDSRCLAQFEKSLPVVKGIRDYQTFYKNLYYSDFRSAPGVPWTGLGYTFDWGNPLTDQGASEFILVPGAGYEISRVVPTMDYCDPPPGNGSAPP